MRSLHYSSTRVPCRNIKERRHNATLASHLLFLQEHSCLLQETRKNISHGLVYAKLDLETMKVSLQKIRGNLQINLVMFSEDLRKVFNSFARTREYQRKICNSQISKLWDENLQLTKTKQNFLLFEKKTRNAQHAHNKKAK
mmetsp:Transcript_17239/g.24116  ORF Transcript_17239/g.24116 Transcript_17239/m.24116 type:complete len:141 (-) Transcript_17239:953-1375(-)